MKIIFRIFAVVVLVVGAVFGGLAWRRLCLPLWGLEVSVNGRVQDRVSAQSCPNRLIRVVIPRQTEVLIEGDLRGGYYPGTKFHNILGLTFANDTDPGGVSMSDRIKVESDPNFEFSENSMAYTDVETHERIVIKILK